MKRLLVEWAVAVAAIAAVAAAATYMLMRMAAGA